MHLFSTGIEITNTEHKSLLHIVADPEEWLLDVITEKAKSRRDALIKEWEPRLFNDESVTELPADVNQLCDLIMARNDYKTRLQQDADQDPPEVLYRHNVTKFEGISRNATVTLFPDGLDLTDIDSKCILAYVQDLEDWVIGALLGQINRGKKRMLREWKSIIIADPDVSTMPATEEGLINMIVARDDYKAMHR